MVPLAEPVTLANSAIEVSLYPFSEKSLVAFNKIAFFFDITICIS
jgi:hypothetical protein